MATRTTVQITMPQMGESVTEGTILEWLKQVGDTVERDEGVVEVSTDKVDTEVPAPADGTLTRIAVEADETVPVGTVLGEIETGGGHVEPSGNGGAPKAAAPPAVTEEATPARDRPEAAASEPEHEAASAAGEPDQEETVELRMPEMGESVTEGTVLEWLKQVGDTVERDEGVVEVSTDKVDTEVPAPVAGRIVEVLAEPDETVPVGAPLCRIAAGAGAEAALAEPDGAGEATAASTGSGPSPAGKDGGPARTPEVPATPVAQRIAAAHGIDLGRLSGSGPRGRVTKDDVLTALKAGAGGDGAGAEESVTATEAPTAAAPEQRPLRGPAATAARLMNESRSIPTATSFRTVPVDVLDERRRALKAAGKKLSFTHLVAWAIVQAAREMPTMTHGYEEVDGKPVRVDPRAVNLGLAVDVERKGGTRALMVPVVHGADRLSFDAFVARYDELVEGARTGGLSPEAYQGAGITLTNPGGLGTVASVPRLMPGQGTIVATGAIGYPVGLAQVDPDSLRELGVTKVMTMTSTYDHRVIQGAESGAFLRRVEELLQGQDGFYQQVFSALGAQVEAVDRGPAAPAPAPERAAPARLGPAVPAVEEELLGAVQAATSVVKAHRMHGHLAARLDPLESEPVGDPALDPANVNLTDEQMRAIPAHVLRVAVPGDTFAEALPRLQETYCGTIAYEIEHISDHDQRVWLRQAIESGAFRAALDAGRRRALLERLTEVEALETYIHKAFLGKKSFSIEGLDALVPMLDETIEMAAAEGAREVVLGMAHRGRLNVLAHIVGRSYEAILAEFEGEQSMEVQTALPEGGTGDVKYHHGATGTYRTSGGKGIGVTLAPNPSHLEYVNPVVVGRARADQTSRKGREAHHDPTVVLPVLIHGDASFPGQGVVAETLNLSGLKGYTTGGTVHIITNNQLGFTTGEDQARSTRYASDLAKGYDIPIIHVNADDVEACISASWLAFAYRDRFRRDVLIDLVGYRRYGHNETDEPAYTQPMMYERIRRHPPVRKLYADRLVAAGAISPENAEEMAQAAHKRLTAAHDDLKASLEQPEHETGEFEVDRSPSREPRTAVSEETLRSLNNQLHRVPEGFTLHRKLRPQLERRRNALEEEGRVDWAHAESLAWASLLQQGVPLRLTGQDTERGTFSQRHLVLHDARTGETHAPIQSLTKAQAPFELHNSPLSEVGCLGFEYGYSSHSPEALVMWEAQFGDFVNAAQVIIDQFLVSGLSKWGIASRLTLLLPHGYEGAGPEHSSGRLERFINLASEGNIRIANCTTPAQYFHLLRRQALVSKRRPLVIMTPKSLLRHPAAASPLEELTGGGFRSVLDDPTLPGEREKVTRLVLCSGKIYYDITQHEQRPQQQHVAVGRVELLYPFAANELVALMSNYPSLERVVWAQEEPQNMGARSVMEARLRAILPDGVGYDYVGRPLRASPGEGYPPAHLAMQSRIVRAALELDEPRGEEAERSALQTTTRSGTGS